MTIQKRENYQSADEMSPNVPRFSVPSENRRKAVAKASHRRSMPVDEIVIVLKPKRQVGMLDNVPTAVPYEFCNVETGCVGSVGRSVERRRLSVRARFANRSFYTPESEKLKSKMKTFFKNLDLRSVSFSLLSPDEQGSSSSVKVVKSRSRSSTI